MSITRRIKENYIRIGRRTIPIQLVKELIAEIERLHERGSDHLDAILILTAEIAKLKNLLRL